MESRLNGPESALRVYGTAESVKCEMERKPLLRDL